MAKVIGMGNALVDIMTKLDHDEYLNNFRLPKGSMTLVDEILSNTVSLGTEHLERIQSSGGSAANTIHGLAKLGVETAFMGKVGKDEFGDFFNEDLVKNKIDPKLFFSDNMQSGKAIALISPDSERTFATYLGAAVDLSEKDLKPEHFKDYQYFHIEGYLVQNHKLIEKAVRIAKENNLIVSLDMASYNIVAENLEFLKLLINQYVDIVFANEEEAKSFTGQEPEEAVKIISSMSKIAVVKTGPKGSLIKSGDSLHEVGVIDVNSIDTTGAGDLYASGFIYGLINEYPLDKCGETGAILAGKVIEIIGAKMNNTHWQNIKELIKNP